MKIPSFTRADRIKKLLHKEIAKIIASLKDPRAKYITVTDVEVSQDLKKAKIYYTVMHKNNIDSAKLMFNVAKGYIRSKVASKLDLKHAIEIEFIYDKFIEQSSRVLFLLDKIKDEDSQK
ncbi:MAG: 30S ribosome-binding factor RbfA [Endomicrobia bacterium]|nr:30S ribosome-binding factor RbfA [Endomicrobiia bacterium]